MSFISSDRKEIVYFDVNASNTDATLTLAKRRAEELGIKSIVVASTRGGTGVKASKMFKGYNLIVVTHHTGFKKPDYQELTIKNMEEITKNGGKILTTTHALGGVGRAIRIKFNTYQYDEIIAYTLRLFGQGVKVACEITMMAVDSGLISTKEDIISIGGTDSGVDTALVIKPVNTRDLFDMRVREIICKPRL